MVLVLAVSMALVEQKIAGVPLLDDLAGMPRKRPVAVPLAKHPLALPTTTPQQHSPNSQTPPLLSNRMPST